MPQLGYQLAHGVAPHGLVASGVAPGVILLGNELLKVFGNSLGHFASVALKSRN